MGSGKGRTRRISAASRNLSVAPVASASNERASAQMTSAAASYAAMTSAGPQERRVVFKVSLWDEFVDPAGVGDVRLREYYLGQAPKVQPRDLTDAECELILGGLFADAVDVGAIKLPKPHKAEDFQFAVRYANTRGEDVKITLKSKPGQARDLVWASETARDHTLSSAEVIVILSDVAKGVHALVN